MTDPEIKQIICGIRHTIIYRNNGDILVCGHNGEGQLGLGDDKNRNKPELLMTDPEIKQIICGSYHTMIWRNNGDVLVCSVCCGSNLSGQLGLGDNQNRNKLVFLISKNSPGKKKIMPNS